MTAAVVVPCFVLLAGVVELGGALLQHAWTHPPTMVVAALFFLGTWALGWRIVVNTSRIGLSVDGDRVIGRQGSRQASWSLGAVGGIKLDSNALTLVDSDGRVIFRSGRLLWSAKQVRSFSALTGLPLAEERPSLR
jgi:hypothetical protein